ncbi:MAG: hypothetical protein EP350_04070 [Alphaproteobacteria bacterium]|nr:MAG: hypothetical protein EP350_04070 [Alphaproteobacteria bacterium]
MLDLLVHAAEVAHGGEHAEPTAFGFLTPAMTIAIAMLVVIAIMLRAGVPGMIARGLDSQIDAIRKQLDEAAKLRAEAEELKASYAKKMAAADGEIAELKASAEKQAEEIVAKAKADAAGLVQRRKKMAQDKIAAAEREAVEQLRAKAATAAAAASRALIAEQHGADADRKLADEIISGL